MWKLCFFQKIIIFSTFFTTIAFFVTTNCPLCRQGGFSCILGGGAVLGQKSRAAKSIPTVNNLLTWLQNDVIFICLRYRGWFSHVLCLITSCFVKYVFTNRCMYRVSQKNFVIELPAPGFAQSLHPTCSAFPRGNRSSTQCSDCAKPSAGNSIRNFVWDTLQKYVSAI